MPGKEFCPVPSIPDVPVAPGAGLGLLLLSRKAVALRRAVCLGKSQVRMQGHQEAQP